MLKPVFVLLVSLLCSLTMLFTPGRSFAQSRPATYADLAAILTDSRDTFNAAGCLGDTGWSASDARRCSVQLRDTLVAMTGTYSLACTGPGGTARRSVTVMVTATTPTPAVSLAPVPASVTPGGSSTLTWSSSNATTRTASSGWSGAQALSDQAVVLPVSSTTYTLPWMGGGGTAAQSTPVAMAGGGSSGGKVINAASCSQAHVQAAVNTASNGDTVAVPGGTCSWNAAVSIPSNKKITLRGGGRDSTIITRSPAGPVLNLSQSGSRVTGFTFSSGRINVDGDDWRIDNNRFTAASPFFDSILVFGDRESIHPRGVIDHNEFLSGARINVVGWSNLAAHAIWSQPLALGNASGQKVFVEDNTFSYSQWSGVFDTNYGGRFVFRNNTVTNGYLEVHSLQQGRASRSWEIYGNTFAQGGGAGLWVPLFVRGGTGVIYDNTVSGTWRQPSIVLDNVRSFDGNGREFGWCNGSSTADGNQLGNGWPCRDQIGRGSDVSRSAPSNNTPTATRWSAQASEPAYFWNNVAPGGGPLGVYIHNGTDAWIVGGRDYVNNTPRPGYVPFAYPHPLTATP